MDVFFKVIYGVLWPCLSLLILLVQEAEKAISQSSKSLRLVYRILESVSTAECD